MDCRTISEIMMKMMDGPLSEKDAADLEHHVSQCTVCRREYEEWTTLTQLLEQLPILEPSSGFDSRVMAAIDPHLYTERASTRTTAKMRNPMIWFGALGLLSLTIMEAGRWLHQSALGWMQGTQLYQAMTLVYETAVVRTVLYFLMPQRWLLDLFTHFESNYQWWHALGVLNLVMILILIKVSLDRLLAGGRGEAL